MPPCSFRHRPCGVIVPAVLLLLPPTLAGQRTNAVRATIDSTAVEIAFDAAAGTVLEAGDRRLQRGGAIPLGERRDGLLVTAGALRVGTRIVHSGRYAMRLERDRYGTWLALLPVDTTERPVREQASVRIPLESEPSDTASARLDIRFERVHGTSETIIFGYDTLHRREINRYSLETESNRGLMRLVIEWDGQRWGVPVTAAGEQPR